MGKVRILAFSLLALGAAGCGAARPATLQLGSGDAYGLRWEPAGWVHLDAPAYLAVIQMTDSGARIVYPDSAAQPEAFEEGRSPLRVGPLMTGSRPATHWLCERPGEQFTGISTPQNVPPGSEVREIRRRGYSGYCFRPPGFSLGSAPGSPLEFLIVASPVPLTHALLAPRLDRYEPGPWTTDERRLADLQSVLGLTGEWGGYYYRFVR